MRLVRIGVASTSVKVGDFAGNLAMLRDVITTVRDQGVHLVVTPELSLSGYSLEDRIWWPDIAKRSWRALEDLATSTEGIAAFVGLPIVVNGLMHNGAALIYDGKIRGVLLKKYLPTYGIFYEGRNWTPWVGGVTEVEGIPVGDLVFKLPFGVVSGEICEDLWSVQEPNRDRVLAGAEIICNLSASPFTPMKSVRRRRLVTHTAERLACVYAYSNLLGLDNSRLVFDGGGFIATPEGVAAEGDLLSFEPWTMATSVVNLDDLSRFRSENTTWREFAAHNVSCEADVGVIDLSEGSFTPATVDDYVKEFPEDFYVEPAPAVASNRIPYLDELFDALVLGLRDYFHKVGVFEKFLIALSGGRDSALCLVAAAYATRQLPGGSEGRIDSVYLPSDQYSTSATRTAAESLAKALDVPFRVVSIEEESKIALAKAAELAGGEDKVTPLSRQNIQARVRGTMMLNWANNVGGLLLVTSNLSEAAVGYTTTGGDNQGGYSPIANIPKTLVSRLLDYIAERDGIAPLKEVLAIPPSAELADGQTDEDDLMPYAVLDDVLYLFARRRLALPDCWRILVRRHPNHDAEQLREWTAKFGKLFAASQWKREQLPVALKLLDLDLDPKTGFRFPVTQSIDNELAELAEAKI